MMTPHIRMRLANKSRGEGVRAEGATIWLYDAIAASDEEAELLGGVSPRQFIAELASINGPVLLRINSPGGSVFGAQAMVVAMRQHPAPITAQIDGLAASAASVIAAEAAHVEMAVGAMMMIHKAWGVTIGNADDMMAMAALLEKIDGQIAETYARRANRDAAHFLSLMAAETWFTAEEAAEAGLSDATREESTQRVAARWDLSAYAKAPCALGAPPAPQTPDMRAMRARQVAARVGRAPDLSAAARR
jgi:ATP-dependent protease ClpP protease subunit